MSVINSIPLIAAGDDGYQISRSVRLRSSASAYLDRTMTASFTSQRIFTFSFWCKRGTLSSATQTIFDRNQSTNVNQFTLGFSPDDTFGIAARTSGTSTVSLQLITSGVFRDPSAWYHFVISVDNTQATLANRGKIYVNGVLQSLGTQTATQNVNYHLLTGLTYNIGRTALGSTNYVDGYLTEFNFIDGQQLDPSSFGETNPITGIWQPKRYAGTYGNNGFYLNFSDNSAATAAAIGKDYSGNGNNWTPNNISVTAGVTYDSMTDVPTLTSATAANYATLNPLDTATAMQASLASGNLELNANTAASGNGNSRATIAVDSGKWYFEATLSGYAGSSNLRTGWDFAIAGVGTGSSGITGAYKDVSSNQTVIIAVDLDNLLAWVGSNGTWDAGDPSAGTGGTSISLSGYLAVPFVRDNSGTAGNGGKWSANFGQRPFSYTPPTGFLALNTQNLPDSTIKNGAAYMAATTYTGTGATQSITNTVNGISFQPDLVWIKQRSAIRSHRLHDSVRGVNKQLFSDTTGAETSNTDELTAFNSNGFTLSTSAGVNASAGTYVGWQWNAGGSTVTNTSGSISAQVRANPTAGFSVVTYTGTGANATVGHGLGVAPKMVIVKNRGQVDGWAVYHANQNASPASGYTALNETAAFATTAVSWNNTVPTSTVFSVGTSSRTNASAVNMVAYCFAAVAGYSAFGSYTGNGSADGPFVYCGFRPRWVMIKNASDGTRSWYVYDSDRDTYNVMDSYLLPNLSNAEGTTTTMDFLSNGFKIRDSAAYANGSGNTIIYAAFAENPFKNSLAR